VAASYRLLPHLASRERLYSLHYQFLGVTQYGEAPYAIPDDVSIVAEDRRDLLTYRAQYADSSWAASHLAGGDARLRSLEKGMGAVIWPYRLFGVEAVPTYSAFTMTVPTPYGLPEDYALHAEVTKDGKIRAIDLPLEWPTTVVSIHTDGFDATDPPSFSSRFERQEAIYGIDGLRTPERQILSRKVLPGS
jgi:hypothetical protein